MACFIVPGTEAIVLSVASKIVAKRQKTASSPEAASGGVKVSWARKLSWLSYMLWGGSALLAFEHVWHGEVSWYFPFLVNAANPDTRAEMLHEMATTGVLMAVLVTAAWALGLWVVSRFEARVAAAKN